MAFRESDRPGSRANSAEVIRLGDGRAIGLTTYGDPAGVPVIALHGFPGSRLMYAAIDVAAARQGVRVIAFDRPGFGRSDPHPGATLLDIADDAGGVADALGLDRFAVLGASGGGHYALACAARLDARVTTVGVVSGIGPLRTPRSLSEMASANRTMFRVARLSPRLVGALLPRLVGRGMATMEAHVRAGTSPSPAMSPELFAVVVADQREAVRQAGTGITLDARNLWRPWGFELSDIALPVHLWHGDADDLAPVGLARIVAGGLPNCRATFFAGEGHVEPLTRHTDQFLAALIAWLTLRRRSSERTRVDIVIPPPRLLTVTSVETKPAKNSRSRSTYDDTGNASE